MVKQVLVRLSSSCSRYAAQGPHRGALTRAASSPAEPSSITVSDPVAASRENDRFASYANAHRVLPKAATNVAGGPPP
jgi:hypothetical protein